jgi:hypothetical protein
MDVLVWVGQLEMKAKCLRSEGQLKLGFIRHSCSEVFGAIGDGGLGCKFDG